MGIINKKYAYIVISEDGKLELVYKDTPNLELKECYEKVNCRTIEVVHPMLEELNEENLILIVDEDGKLKRKTMNIIASMLFNHPMDVIVGKCILCTEICEEEEDTDLYAMPSTLAEEYYKSLSEIHVKIDE